MTYAVQTKSPLSLADIRAKLEAKGAVVKDDVELVSLVFTPERLGSAPESVVAFVGRFPEEDHQSIVMSISSSGFPLERGLIHLVRLAIAQVTHDAKTQIFLVESNTYQKELMSKIIQGAEKQEVFDVLIEAVVLPKCYESFREADRCVEPKFPVDLRDQVALAAVERTESKEFCGKIVGFFGNSYDGNESYFSKSAIDSIVRNLLKKDTPADILISSVTNSGARLSDEVATEAFALALRKDAVLTKEKFSSWKKNSEAGPKLASAMRKAGIKTPACAADVAEVLVALL